MIDSAPVMRSKTSAESATIARQPSAAELALGLKAVGANRQTGAQNLQWALLNSPEFLFNY